MSHNLSQARHLIQECLETQSPYLDLGNCGITDLDDLPELWACTHLETLIISNERRDYEKKETIESQNAGPKNKLQAISYKIGNLSQLTTLRIGGDFRNRFDIVDLSPLQSLRKITELDLSENQISDLSPLESLQQITTLDLSENQTTTLDLSPLSSLHQITTLNLSGNQISDLSPLNSLHQITTLFLSFNQISDLSPLNSLHQITTLDLSFNQISDLSPLNSLHQITTLFLSRNQISDLSPLSSLNQITTLKLSENQISDLSPLNSLQNLEDLSLIGCSLTKLPKYLFRLNIKPTFEKWGRGLALADNPIESPPPEIIKQGRKAVLDWFAADKVALNEIKVILIGEPKAGKTSLLRRLKEDDYRDQEVQTDGINIESLEFGSRDTFQDYPSIHDWTGHFWDFGGQEIMNNTHRFFLTQRSIYILMLDARKDTNISAQIRKWVQRIEATGGDSPVIVVANKIDINPGFGFDNEYELKEEFPQIVGFIKASCCTKEEIETVKSLLVKQIKGSEHTSIDRRWVPIKDELEERTSNKHFLNETEFRSICKKHELEDRAQQKSAIEFFHDLGLLLHFRNLNLAEYYVLDPYWITYGVYQIVTSNRAGKLQGTVSMNDLEYIVNEEEEKQEVYKPSEFKRITYSTAERRFLVDILQEFKLCFYTPDRAHFILPDLLPTAEPKDRTQAIRSDENAIRFVYEYAYLPKSVLPRIMVDAHHLLLAMWRTGCVLDVNDCQVLLTDYQERINITVAGEHKKKREALSVIRHLMDSEITPTMSETPQMLIPLPGTKEYVDYEELIEREKEGEIHYRLFRPVKKSFEISKLLEGIAPKGPPIGMHDKLDQLLKGNRQLQYGQSLIMTKLNTQYKYLVSVSSKEGITAKIIEETMTQITTEQSQALSEDLMQFLVTAFSTLDGSIDEKLTPIYEELQKAEDTQLKLKLGLPLAGLTGVQLEGEFNLQNWSKRMYDKYGLLVFEKMMGVK